MVDNEQLEAILDADDRIDSADEFKAHLQTAVDAVRVAMNLAGVPDGTKRQLVELEGRLTGIANTPQPGLSDDAAVVVDTDNDEVADTVIPASEPDFDEADTIGASDHEHEVRNV